LNVNTFFEFFENYSTKDVILSKKAVKREVLNGEFFSGRLIIHRGLIRVWSYFL